jgi:hypothetical protein
LRQQGHSNDDTLLLSTGELMGVSRHDAVGIGKPHVCEYLRDAFYRLRCFHPPVITQNLP